MKIHHIAYVVGSIEKAIRKFELLGFRVHRESLEDPDRDIRICFMKNISDGNTTCIELVEPISEKSPVSNFCSKMNGAAAPYHICYEVDSIADTVDELKREGFL